MYLDSNNFFCNDNLKFKPDKMSINSGKSGKSGKLTGYNRVKENFARLPFSSNRSHSVGNRLGHFNRKINRLRALIGSNRSFDY